MAVSNYLIIGGAPKSATTSLYAYLSDHPRVCASNRKETYFFARDFDHSNVCQCDETLDSFESYFAHCSDKESLRIEATPYTIYSKNAAEKIANLLPNANMMFILRDPVERFISDYRFSIQREHPSSKGTLEDFMEWQRWIKGDTPSLLEMGRYINYLGPFYEILGRDRNHIIFFEEFITKPIFEMRKLCSLVGLDPAFYTDYRFKPQNKTVNVRYPSLNRVSMRFEYILNDARATMVHYPKVHRIFENAVNLGKSTYHFLNNKGPIENDSEVSQLRGDLADYFRPYNESLSKFLGRPLPWKSFQNP